VVEMGMSLKIDQWKALKEEEDDKDEEADVNARPMLLGIEEVKLYLENLKDKASVKHFTDYITEVRNWCMLLKNKKDGRVKITLWLILIETQRKPRVSVHVCTNTQRSEDGWIFERSLSSPELRF
jgi:hypothetical protein